MIRFLLCAAVPVLLAVNPPRLPEQKDPCLQKCQDEFRKKSGACQSKSCFSEKIEEVKQCSLGCGKKKENAERKPVCTNDKGKKVPCSDLPHKPQPAR
jgi:hypothetical protein